MTGSLDGLTNIKNINQKVILGDGRSLRAERVGDLRLKIVNNGSYVVLKDVKVYLFSAICASKSGASIKSKGEGIIVLTGKTDIGFDEILKIGKGHLMAAKMEVNNDYGLVGGSYTFENVMEYHKKLGHPSIKATKKTAAANHIKLTEKIEICERCILAKLKRTKISKLNPHKANKKGERLCVDISWIKKSSIGNNKYWLLIEDKFTSMEWTFFVNRKPEAGKIIVEFIKAGRNKDPDFGKNLRFDNSGENQAMVANMKKEALEILIEFTAPYTPGQNGKVKRSFATYGEKRERC